MDVTKRTLLAGLVAALAVGVSSYALGKDAAVKTALDGGIEVAIAEGEFLTYIEGRLSDLKADWVAAANKAGIDGARRPWRCYGQSRRPASST